MDRVACWGALYCGDFCDHWTGTWQDPTWERNGKDSGKIKIQYNVYHAYRNVRWISPGKALRTEAIIAGIGQGNQGSGNTYDDCSGGDAMGTTASGTAELIQTSANPYGHLDYDIRVDRTSSSFTFNEDLGYYPGSYDLNDNFKILPPTGLTGSVTDADYRKVKVNVNIASWSANANITGAPYTGDGGRDWNFRAQIKDGGTVVAEKTISTGETKNGTITIDNLNLDVGKNYTMHITCSNNYQQTVDYDVTFTVPFYGWVVTSGSAKKIKGFAVIDSIEDGSGVHYSVGYPKEV